MPVDRSKLPIWLDLLTRKKVVDALKKISTTNENFDWARENLVEMAREPSPPKLTTQQAYDQMIENAKEGETVNLGKGEFSVTISK